MFIVRKTNMSKGSSNPVFTLGFQDEVFHADCECDVDPSVLPWRQGRRRSLGRKASVESGVGIQRNVQETDRSTEGNNSFGTGVRNVAHDIMYRVPPVLHMCSSSSPVLHSGLLSPDPTSPQRGHLLRRFSLRELQLSPNGCRPTFSLYQPVNMYSNNCTTSVFPVTDKMLCRRHSSYVPRASRIGSRYVKHAFV